MVQSGKSTKFMNAPIYESEKNASVDRSLLQLKEKIYVIGGI